MHITSLMHVRIVLFDVRTGVMEKAGKRVSPFVDTWTRMHVAMW